MIHLPYALASSAYLTAPVIPLTISHPLPRGPLEVVAGTPVARAGQPVRDANGICLSGAVDDRGIAAVVVAPDLYRDVYFLEAQAPAIDFEGQVANSRAGTPVPAPSSTPD
jgi:hypothetical protein